VVRCGGRFYLFPRFLPRQQQDNLALLVPVAVSWSGWDGSERVLAVSGPVGRGGPAGRGRCREIKRFLLARVSQSPDHPRTPPIRHPAINSNAIPQGQLDAQVGGRRISTGWQHRGETRRVSPVLRGRSSSLRSGSRPGLKLERCGVSPSADTDPWFQRPGAECSRSAPLLALAPAVGRPSRSYLRSGRRSSILPRWRGLLGVVIQGLASWVAYGRFPGITSNAPHCAESGEFGCKGARLGRSPWQSRFLRVSACSARSR